jgi:DNA-binding NarL/FixJ family response regulator
MAKVENPERQTLAIRRPNGLVVESVGSQARILVFSFPLESEPSAHVDLTPSELAVIAELQRGATNRDIAARRGVSVRTVANQLASAFRKLRCHSRLDVARLTSRSSTARVAQNGCAIARSGGGPPRRA